MKAINTNLGFARFAYELRYMTNGITIQGGLLTYNSEEEAKLQKNKMSVKGIDAEIVKVPLFYIGTSFF